MQPERVLLDTAPAPNPSHESDLMTRTDKARSTPKGARNDLSHNPADTSMTPLLIRQAKRDAARLLPAGWFTFVTDETATAGQDYDILHFVQVEGVPVGNYGLHREPSRQFSLVCLDHALDEDGEQVARKLGLFETTEGAVKAILTDLRRAMSELQQQANRWTAALAA